jgi:heme oxygenase (biliverdin-IX-beta and delta-forming)
MATSRQHAAPASGQSVAVPEPSLAERARTLVHLGRLGSLSTQSRKHPGFPFGSVMPYAADEQGRPLLLISTMAMHTQNLQADGRASLLIAQEAVDDPLAAARVTLLGDARPLADAETAAARQCYLARYDQARYWVDFNDFHFYRLQPVDIYFIGGFGVMGWVSERDYAAAQPDPLAESAAGILQHMNMDHKEALVLLARAAGHPDVELAGMTAIDRLGFHLRLQSGERVHGVRIAFPSEVRSTAEVRTVLVQMVHAARQP